MTDERKDLSTNFPTNLNAAFSENEKAVVREQLRAYMREHPARVPVWIRFLEAFQSSAYNPTFQLASATLALLLIGGTGTAFAAQGALPGEPLYGVKVNIEEPIAGAFVRSPQAQANWNAELASRRLSEAEQLAVRNKLTPEIATTVAGGFDQAAANFDASVAQLATSSSNAATVATIASNMEATLAANTQILSEIASSLPSSASTIEPILASVKERAVSLNSARTAMDETAAEANSEQVKLAAQSALGNAVDQIDQAMSNAQIAPSSTSSATAQVQAAQQQLSSGQQDLDQGDYIAALENLQAASVEARAAQLNISIRSQLRTDTNLGPDASSTPYVFPISPTTTTATSSDSVSTSTSATSSTSTAATTSSIHIFRKQRFK